MRWLSIFNGEFQLHLSAKNRVVHQYKNYKYQAVYNYVDRNTEIKEDKYSICNNLRNKCYP